MHHRGAQFRFAVRVGIAWLSLSCLFQTGRPIQGWQAGEESSALPAARADQLRYEVLPGQTWEIGLEIAATGHASGITAVFPLPVDWPEQTVKILGQQVEPASVEVELDERDPEVKLVEVSIPRLAAGETARVVLQVAITKANILPPSDPSGLVFAERIPRDVKPWLQPSPYIECRQKKIVELARSLPVDENLPAWQQVEAIYDWVRDNIEYEFDPQIRTCQESLAAGHGDCEELSSLFIALCRARGIPARAVWIPEHTYPEFYLEDAAGNGCWFPCQAAGTREFGGMTEARPVLQKGDRFRVPGNRKELRYLQPTLVARDVEAAPTMRFVLREIDRGETDLGGK